MTTLIDRLVNTCSPTPIAVLNSDLILSTDLVIYLYFPALMEPSHRWMARLSLSASRQRIIVCQKFILRHFVDCQVTLTAYINYLCHVVVQ